MSPRVVPPFRADHVGSLLPPQRLVDARAEHAANSLDTAELRQVTDEAVGEVVAMQEQLGLASATDGLLHRDHGHLDFLHRLDGVDESGVRVHERLGVNRTLFGEEFTTLADRARTATPKLTLPSPAALLDHLAVDETVYPERAALRADLAAAYAAEIRALADRGCHYLQLDETELGDRTAQQEPREAIELINAALAGKPETLAVTVGFRRDHPRWRGLTAGDTALAEQVFCGLAVDGFFLDFDGARGDEFAGLRFVPAGRAAVLGLVSPRRPELETSDELKRGIDEAARYVDPGQLCLSPGDGFGPDGLTLEQQRAKLRLVVQTATDVWG